MRTSSTTVQLHLVQMTRSRVRGRLGQFHGQSKSNNAHVPGQDACSKAKCQGQGHLKVIVEDNVQGRKVVGQGHFKVIIVEDNVQGRKVVG